MVSGTEGVDSPSHIPNECTVYHRVTIHTFPLTCTARSYRQDLQRDLGFPNGSMESLEEWNQLDTSLVAWGSVLLRCVSLSHWARAPLLTPSPDPTLLPPSAPPQAGCHVPHGRGGHH